MITLPTIILERLAAVEWVLGGPNGPRQIARKADASVCTELFLRSFNFAHNPAVQKLLDAHGWTVRDWWNANDGMHTYPPELRAAILEACKLEEHDEHSA